MRKHVLAWSVAVAAMTCMGAEAAGQEAQAPTPSGAVEAPLRSGPGHQALAACRADMKALCSGVEAGGGRRYTCLAQNRDKLSAGCKAAIAGVLARNGAPAGDMAGAGPAAGAQMEAHAPVKVHQICRADIARLCAGVQNGEGRIGKCLNDNGAKLSAPCQTALAERKRERQMMRRDVGLACKAEREGVCGGLKGHEALACLRKAQGTLSAGCQQALAKLN